MAHFFFSGLHYIIDFFSNLALKSLLKNVITVLSIDRLIESLCRTENLQVISLPSRYHRARLPLAYDRSPMMEAGTS